MRSRGRFTGSPLREKRRRARFKRALVYAAAAFVVFAAAALASHYRGVRIATATVVGNQATPADAIAFAAEEFLSGSYLLIFPRDNIALFPRRRLESALRERFPRLKEVAVRRESFTSIKISVEERDEKALWCESESLSSCYFLDEGGFVFAQAPSFTGDVYLRFYGALSSTTALRARFLDDSSFQRLFFFLEQVKKIGIIPRSVAYRQEDNDFEVRDSFGVSILLQKSDEYNDTFSNLETAYSSEELRGRWKKLSYVDLRFGNKAYFKFKN